MGRTDFQCRGIHPFRPLSRGVPGIGQAVQRRASARACDLGQLRPLPLHRVPPAASARGLFRVDGSGDEYDGGVCRSFDFDGVEEGGGGENSCTFGPNWVSYLNTPLNKSVN